MRSAHRLTAAVALAALTLAGCGRSGSPRASRVTASPIVTATPEPPDTPPPATPSPAPTPAATRLGTRPPLTPRPTATEDLRPRLADARIKLTRIASLDEPLWMEPFAGRLYVAEKGGRVKTLSGGGSETVLDISSQVSTDSEQGLLGFAFAPDGRFLYVHFTNTRGDTRVVEYALTDGRPDLASAREVLAVDQPYANHNGGQLAFGPDDKLYLGLGDGGSGGDPQRNGQSLATLLGKILRIDPRPVGGQPYVIPADNPFVGRAGARGEIWAYGLRNPWRFSFDRVTKDLWIGDVGQDKWEEVDWRVASSRGGENYGWSRMEGTHRFSGDPPGDHVPPVYEYSHDEGCSITGGDVYRGQAVPALRGAYVFADFCEGRLRAIVVDQGVTTVHRFLGPKVENLSSFGRDASDELYVLSLDGGVYRIDGA